MIRLATTAVQLGLVATCAFIALIVRVAVRDLLHTED